VSIACFIGAFYFWRLGNEWRAKKTAATKSTAPAKPALAPGAARETVQPASTAPLALLPFAQRDNAQGAQPLTHRQLLQKYRLTNTTKTAGQLSRSDQAILLANASIDSSQPIHLNIPDSLRSEGDAGAYIVQSRRVADDFFRAQLRGAGATIIAYIPNNAYLVQVSEAGAQRLADTGLMQSVLPYEPYFKIPDLKLLATAVEGEALPPDAVLNVVTFPGSHDDIVNVLTNHGLTILGEDRTPFGPMFKVQPKADSLPAIAQLPIVQTIEVASQRVPANDLSRTSVGITTNSTTTSSYLDLIGSNIIVNVNDSGVDTNHPDLFPRVFADAPISGVDSNGHGTHVAGIIGSSGLNSRRIIASGSVPPPPPVPNHFRGMAPAVQIFSASIFNNVSDSQLQQNAAATNALISNNSWNYGSSDYDVAAANFDAAVRDSLPGTNGSQPLVYVFSAGDAGNGNDDGDASSGESVHSPATAKNVITVGAVEQLRNITNLVSITNATSTNVTAFWQGRTDSDNQIASFSSRGNVGVDIEGDFGRFKPDLVAPGTFVVSTRSEQWNEQAYYNPTNYHTHVEVDDIKANAFVTNGVLLLPDNTVELFVSATALIPLVDMPVYVRQGQPPTPTQFDFMGTNSVTIPGSAVPLTNFWFFGVLNPTNQTVRYQFTTTYATTNDNGDYFQVLSNLNDSLEPSVTDPTKHLYRYESGTSMSAADVSGVLALIADFFSNKVANPFRPSPALMKAMLINGARTINSKYDFQVQKTVNDQGWGEVSLSNSVPLGITNGYGAGNISGGMLYFEQDPTNHALATGDSFTYNIQIDPAAQNNPLQITVVWTDPPGNPSAGIKLVNDIDLVVTNLDDTSLVYYGNDIPSGSTVNFPWDTNSPPNIDNINNVENIFLDVPVGTNYSVTVIGHRINVNAVTAHTNNVVQDFALVMSSGDGTISNAITLVSTNSFITNAINLTVVTNEFQSITNISGQLLLNQHVGAYSPLVGTEQVTVGTNTVWKDAGTNGVITMGATNQWHFYVLTNNTPFTNAAFATFLAQTLAVPRMGPTNYILPEEATRVESDIDMFVSKDPALLQMDPAALTAADKSLKRLGTELVAYTNAAQNDVYYVGIHSEDRQAGEYAFFGVFSELPFSQSDSNGVLVRGINVPANIPDGTPDKPGGAMVIGIALQEITMRRVIVTNTISHENGADLFGVLNHDRVNVVLNNHSCQENPATLSCFTNFSYVYEDNGENDIAGSRHTDGPGSLTDYMGSQGQGIWLLTEVDNSLGSTGRVDNLWIRLQPQDDPTGAGVELNIAPNSFGFLAVDVPPEATNMTICVANESTTPLPLELFVRRGDLPTQTNFDQTIPIPVTGACLSVNRGSFPPLQAGRYYIGVFNPNNIFQRVRVIVTIDQDPRGVTPLIIDNFNAVPILDDAVSYSSIYVPFNSKIIRAEVGVAIQHPRISDLAITLISPLGKRILLFENRGGPDAQNMGNVVTTTNFTGTVTAGGPGANTNSIPIPASGILVINYDFFTEPDTMDVYYGGTNIFGTGLINGAGTFSIPFGPGPFTNIVIVMNGNGNPSTSTAWNYTPQVISQQGQYFLFSENTNFTTLPIKFATPPFISGTTVTTNAVEACPPPSTNSGWTQWSGNGHWYKAVATTNITWNQASQIASNECGYLATITSSNENAFVFSLVNAAGFFTSANGAGPALGGYQPAGSTEPAGNWRWVTGEPWVYTNWFPLEPDNGGGGEDRLQFYSSIPNTPDARWNDVGQNDPNVGGYVIERDSSPALEVATPFFNPANNHFYYLVAPLGWTQAVAAAQSLGGNLATINDNAENLWVYNNIVAPSSTRDPWIGYYSFSASYLGPYTWISGETDSLSPIPWYAGTGEPNNIGGAPYGVNYFPNNPGLFPGGAAQWNNAPMTDVIDSIAEVPAILDIETNIGAQYFPEESLQALVGDPAIGNWTLEIWDNRAGATNPAPMLLSWQMRFILETNVPSVTPLTFGVPYTNTIPNCSTQYFSVDVPDWAGSATNILLSSSVPVNMWFNQTNLPLTGSPGDFELLNGSIGGIGNPVLTTNSNPALIPGARYFLAVENPCANGTNATFGIEVNFSANVIRLTNMVPYTNFISAASTNSLLPSQQSQSYVYTVSTNAARAQFEILEFPTSDMTLVARLGLPPPTLFSFDLASDNPSTNGELIVVLTNSTPVSLQPGDWYLTAYNVGAGPAAYTIMASEWPVTGRPFTITNFDASSNSFCITWTSLPGVHYFVEGIPTLASRPWIAMSPTITAVDYSTTFCIPLPSPFHFFRVTEGLSLVDIPGPPPSVNAQVTTNGVLLTWIGPATASYHVQWTPTITPPVWNTFTNVVTSTNTSFSFLDDGTQSGGLGGTRFYQVIQP
jgi:subtilisin-like proprotein convertase family protein